MTDPLEIQAWWVLGIDPTARGFAFAVLAGPYEILDWGTREVKTRKEYVAAIGELCDQYAPHIMALEKELGSRRSNRGPRRIRAAVSVAAERNIATVKFSRSQVNEWFGASGKRDVALRIVDRFPELKDYTPRERTVGASEDERMNIFDAISFALVVLEKL